MTTLSRSGHHSGGHIWIPLSMCLVITSLALASCGVEGETISADYALGAKEESVVIGRGEVYYPESGETDVAFLTLMNDATEKRYRLRYDASHGRHLYFYVALKPGPHRVVGWDNMNRRGTLNGRFDVKAGQVVYIGTLRFTVRSRSASIYAGQPDRLSVIDDYQRAVQSFRKYYPQIKQDVVKSLITLEQD